MANTSPHQQAFSFWQEHTNTSRLETDSYIHHALRKAYPAHHVTRTSQSKCDVLGYAAAGFATTNESSGSDSDATRVYRTPTSRLDGIPGRLEDVVNYGLWSYQWQAHDLLVYEVSYVNRFSQNMKLQYILAPLSGSVEANSRHHPVTDELLAASGAWTNDVHNQIWVFDNAQWVKNKQLWRDVQNASWEDIVLPAPTKAALNRDVHGFFSNRALYAKAQIPWKRGIIFHGEPGNGKSLAIKTLIDALSKRTSSIPSLYVKSIDACPGPKWSIRQIFLKARRCAPCLLIFEDLDSLVADTTRSYFLNEVDGLESNDGVLMIGSTNHLERLDPSVRKRPSRFDRKYHFALPGEEERRAYCGLWSRKMQDADGGVEAGLLRECEVAEVTRLTAGWSFAYLKELFVSSLLMVTHDRLELEDSVTSLEHYEATNGGHTRGMNGNAASLIPQEQSNVGACPLFTVLKDQIALLAEEMKHASKTPGPVQSKVTSAPPVHYGLAAPLDEEDE